MKIIIRLISYVAITLYFLIQTMLIVAGWQYYFYDMLVSISTGIIHTIISGDFGKGLGYVIALMFIMIQVMYIVIMSSSKRGDT